MATRYCALSIRVVLIALALSALLAGCAGPQVRDLPEIPILTAQPEYDIPDADLLGMSPEMQDFVNRYSKRSSSEESKAWLLAYATMDPLLLDFKYDPQITSTAIEAFRERKGNCLTFSGMFVAMARSAGLKAYYQEVEIPPNWSNVNDNLLVGKHVNAVAYDKGQTYTVDVSRRKGREIERARRLSDAEAQAQYYNNLGADALIANDLALAYAYFRKGLENDLKLDYIWSNMGVILRRNGQTEDAILAYNTALQLNPDEIVALNNLHLIYTEDGDLEAAGKLEKRVDRTRRKNPYYMQHLAEGAIEEQRYSDAIELAKKAIRMDAGEYRFYYTLAQSQYLAGKVNLAQASLDQARKRAPDQQARGTLILPAEEF